MSENSVSKEKLYYITSKNLLEKNENLHLGEGLLVILDKEPVDKDKKGTRLQNEVTQITEYYVAGQIKGHDLHFVYTKDIYLPKLERKYDMTEFKTLAELKKQLADDKLNELGLSQKGGREI